MYKGALNCIFNELLKRKDFVIGSNYHFTDKKTKAGKAFLENLKIANALIITSIDNVNAFFLSQKYKKYINY